MPPYHIPFDIQEEIIKRLPIKSVMEVSHRYMARGLLMSITSVKLILGSSNDTIVKTIIGFGVCRQTNDPKLVKITSTGKTSVIDSLSWQVEVFSLSHRTWKTQSIAWNLLDVDEFSYWLAFDGETLNAEFQWYDLVLSIDMTSEEFKQVHSLTSQSVDIDLFISKFRQPLVVLETNVEAQKQVYGLWMKKKRVPKSFKKLFKISTREASITTVSGFRTSGGNINEHLALFFYKRYSNDIKCIRIDGRRYSFFMCHCMDQLFLLDH